MRWILRKTKLFNAKCGKTGKNLHFSKCFFTSLTTLFQISNFRIKSLAKSIPKIALFMFLCYSTVSLLKHFLTSSSNPVILSDPSLTLAIWSFFFFFFLESNEFSNFLNLLLLLENRNVLKLFAHGCPRTNCRNNTGHRCAVCLLWARLGLVAQNSITLLYYSSTIQQIRPEECLPIYRQKKLLPRQL